MTFGLMYGGANENLLVLLFWFTKLTSLSALDLQLLEEKWRDVLWTFGNSRAEDAFIKGLNADFIEGPICSGGVIYCERESCISVPDSYQLCVRSKD